MIQDVARSTGHPACQRPVCLVYDPAGFIKNPTGLRKDLEKLSPDSLIVVQIVPKR